MKTYDEIINLLIEKAGSEIRLAKALKTSRASVNVWKISFAFPKSQKNIKNICEYSGINQYELLYAIEKEKEAKCRRTADKYMRMFLKKERKKK